MTATALRARLVAERDARWEANGRPSPEELQRQMDEFIDRVFPDKEAYAISAQEWWCEEVGICD